MLTGPSGNKIRLLTHSLGKYPLFVLCKHGGYGAGAVAVETTDWPKCWRADMQPWDLDSLKLWSETFQEQGKAIHHSYKKPNENSVSVLLVLSLTFAKA